MLATAIQNPTQVLRHEHEVIKKALAILSVVARRLESGKDVPDDDVASLLDFFRTFADACHHAKEEKALFPALEAAGLPHKVGPVAVMLYEHEIGRSHVRTMVSRAGTMGMPASRREFVDAALAFCLMLTEHIDKENEVLFRMAENMLPPEAKQRIAEEFERHENELGAGTHDRLHATIDRLSARYEVTGPALGAAHACCGGGSCSR